LAALAGLPPSTVQDALSGRRDSSATLLEHLIASAGGRVTVEIPVDGEMVRFVSA
jgi:hypothetical protein